MSARGCRPVSSCQKTTYKTAQCSCSHSCGSFEPQRSQRLQHARPTVRQEVVVSDLFVAHRLRKRNRYPYSPCAQQRGRPGEIGRAQSAGEPAFAAGAVHNRSYSVLGKPRLR